MIRPPRTHTNAHIFEKRYFSFIQYEMSSFDFLIHTHTHKSANMFVAFSLMQYAG